MVKDDTGPAVSTRKRKAEEEHVQPLDLGKEQADPRAPGAPAAQKADWADKYKQTGLKPEGLRQAYDGDPTGAMGLMEHRIASRHLTVTNATPHKIHFSLEVGEVWDWEMMHPSTSHTFPTRRRLPFACSSFTSKEHYHEHAAYLESVPRDDTPPIYKIVAVGKDGDHKLVNSDGDACPTEAPDESDLMAMTIAELELQTKPPPPPTPPPDDPDDKKTFTAAKLKSAKKALDDAEKLPEKTDKEQRIKARIVRQTTHAHEQAKKANEHAIKFSDDFEKKKKEREDAAEKKVKDARDLLEQAEKRQKEAEALPEGTDPEAAAKASQHAKCAMTIKGCKKQVDAALADQKKVADVEVSRQLERKVEQTSRAVDRLKKDLDQAEKLPDDSAKEKKAKTKAVDKAKKDLEKAKSENEVAVKARDKPIQEALQRRIDKCQKLIDEAEKMPETNDQEKQMKLHRIEQCKRAKAKAEKERDKAFPKPKEAPAPAPAPAPAAADAKVKEEKTDGDGDAKMAEAPAPSESVAEGRPRRGAATPKAEAPAPAAANGDASPEKEEAPAPAPRSTRPKRGRAAREESEAPAPAAAEEEGGDDEEEEEEEEEEAPRRRPTRRAASAAKQRTADMMDTS
ncbi:unnamed protein product [Pelagomonas calceolata]|uniref:Uncharacterized protein n=1 Tax=Pelagomonas calceolata TaxID=35677 RepID=A0A8J2SEU0_9STRA|nr:unnamed protein product [Pelagomonas calceolata]|mmetsp:Transcript_22712/g.64012  ORF Transcript_22712/g.64012 Transcript_22712/m.64012 type:complete len:625 (-) Transcript_22712:69-1943(-)